MRKILLFYIFCFIWQAGSLEAKEITIAFTGSTHAMLYPCHCVIEPDGGIARRATLVKDLRQKNPQTLLLDSGSFFAGGLLDEYSQNAQLDLERTRVNLKAMELMKYDAALPSDDEFNFGADFLEKEGITKKIPLISCNIRSSLFKPFLIKEISGVKVAIIGLTNFSARQKAGNIEFILPDLALKEALEQVKKEGAKMVVLLSNLGEMQDLNLISAFPGIDVLITPYNKEGEKAAKKIGNTIVVHSSWQGRRLGLLTLSIDKGKVTGYKTDSLRLSDKLKDDAEVVNILPRCFSDGDCRRDNLSGICQNGGTLQAACKFEGPVKVRLLIIKPKQCRTCDDKNAAAALKKYFPGMVVSYLEYPSPKAEAMIKDFQVKGLPAYFFGKEVQKIQSFTAMKNNFQSNKGEWLMLKPEAVGFAYFLDRKPIKGRLDLFISLYDKDTPNVLAIVKEFNPTVHFLVIEKDGQFDAAKGTLEIEDSLRAVCVQKYYPDIFWDYVACRANNINTSWWEDCLKNYDAAKIKMCARSMEGYSLLKQNVALNQELNVMFGPTYLLDNQEVFATRGAPNKEELRKIIKK